jgi:hypothetical protein
VRVLINVQASAVGTVTVAVPFDGAAANADHDALRCEAPLLLELEVSELGEVARAWLGPQGKLDRVPRTLAAAIIGPDAPERRAALLFMRQHQSAGGAS